ncbi:unnamed protein product [Calypogeia fissa]
MLGSAGRLSQWRSDRAHKCILMTLTGNNFNVDTTHNYIRDSTLSTNLYTRYTVIVEPLLVIAPLFKGRKNEATKRMESRHEITDLRLHM